MKIKFLKKTISMALCCGITAALFVSSGFHLLSRAAAGANELVTTYFTEDFETGTTLDTDKWIASENGVNLNITNGNTYARLTAAGAANDMGDMVAMYTKDAFPINDSLILEYDMNVVKASNPESASAGVQSTMGGTAPYNAFSLNLLSDKAVVTDRMFNVTANEVKYDGMSGWKLNEWYHYKLIMKPDSLQTVITTMDGATVLWDAVADMEIQDLGFVFYALYDGVVRIDNVKISGVQYYGLIPEASCEVPVINPLPPDTDPVNKDVITNVLNDITSAGDSSLLASKGTYYTAAVPDTIDLAERGALFARGLTNFLVKPGEAGQGTGDRAGDYFMEYMAYGCGEYATDTAVLTNYAFPYGSAGCWPKNFEAIALCRNMSGSKDNLDIDNKTFNALLTFTRDSSYSTQTRVDSMLNRVTLAMETVYQLNPSEKLKNLIDELSRDMRKTVQETGDMGYAFNQPQNTTPCYRGIMGYENNLLVNGAYIRALTRWYDISGGSYPYAMQVAEKLKNFIMQPKFWEPEVVRKAVYSPDIAEYDGHMHSYNGGAIGLLRYAVDTNDTALMEFVREAYEQQKNYGLANIGMYGESCGLGDMMVLASQLSLNGVGDYWDDLERYIRNSMAEIQITDPVKLQAALDQHHPLGRNTRATIPNGTTDDTVNRSVGLCLGGLTYPTFIQAREMEWIGCCQGNLPQGMYYAWQTIVTENNGLVSVNMPLNRASEWLDVDSYIPYEGKVALHNKKAEQISFRVPNYVDRAQVKLQINGKDVSFSWIGAYIYMSGLKANDEITITFPLTQWSETCTLKWREDDTRKEGTDPSITLSGINWQPIDPSDSFEFIFVGNTVVKIIPSVDRMTDNATGVYPLYQRDDMLNAINAKSGAPMKTIERFVPDTIIKF